MAEQAMQKRSWWQTLPGVLSAVAAILTAITGLIVAIGQVRADPPSETTAAARTSPLATHPPASTSSAARAATTAATYRVSFPSGRQATFTDGTYEFLRAGAQQRNPGELTVRLLIRLTTRNTPAILWDDAFRLRVDGVPRAPISNLNTVVARNSSVEGTIVFAVPENGRRLELIVVFIDPTVEVKLPLALTRKEARGPAGRR
jgi:hypothetical protein